MLALLHRLDDELVVVREVEDAARRAGVGQLAQGFVAEREEKVGRVDAKLLAEVAEGDGRVRVELEARVVVRRRAAAALPARARAMNMRFGFVSETTRVLPLPRSLAAGRRTYLGNCIDSTSWKSVNRRSRCGRRTTEPTAMRMPSWIDSCSSDERTCPVILAGEGPACSRTNDPAPGPPSCRPPRPCACRPCSGRGAWSRAGRRVWWTGRRR